MSIAGVLVELRVVAALAPAVDALFGGCPSAPAGVAEVVIDRRAAAIAPPPSPPTVVTEDASYWFVDAGVVALHKSGVCGRCLGDVVEVGGVAAAGDHDRALRLATQMPLADALSRLGREVVHAGAVERDGTTLLIAGFSGAGKSTFAYAAQRAGWTVLADDLVIVAETNPVSAWGFPKPLHVPVDVLDDAPAHACAMADDERGRWVIAPPVMSSTDGAPISGVIALGHSDSSARWERGPTGVQWSKELLVSFPLVRVPARLRSALPIAAAVARLPSFRFEQDSVPERRVAAVGTFLGWVGDELCRQ